MPHQCTNCGCAFGDGSKEMLSGCPECGGTTFQFRPASADDAAVPEEEPPEPEGGTVGTHVGRATSVVRKLMSGDSSTDPPDDGTRDADLLDEDTDSSPDQFEYPEDSAQASARSEFVSPDQLPSHTSSDSSSDSSHFEPSDARSSPSATASDPPSDGRVVREPTGDQPDLAELREELNDQFESIKILAPGQYELNLMGLYDREEYIIALQENGHYAIQMPEAWVSDEE